MLIGLGSYVCPDGTVIGEPRKAGDPTVCPSSSVTCTAEEKVCPDGSVVGRIAPDCEFAPCPDDGGSVISIRVRDCPDGTTVSGNEPCPGGDVFGPGALPGTELLGGIRLSPLVLLVGAGIIGLLIFGGKS